MQNGNKKSAHTAATVVNARKITSIQTYQKREAKSTQIPKRGLKMAERRMFSKSVVDSDAFSEMPLTTQALYFRLGMQADDDGFVKNPKLIQRMIGASEDDLKLLLAKGFLVSQNSGIVVVGVG